MPDENKKIEEEGTDETTNKKGGSGSAKAKSSGKKGRGKTRNARSAGNPSASAATSDPAEEPNRDAFQEYKHQLEENEKPAAENDVSIKEEEFDVRMEMRRNQMIHVKNLEENQTEYQAISFNITSLMGNDAKEVKANIDGFVTKNTDLKAKLLAARNAIKNAKKALEDMETAARRIDNAKDNSDQSEQMKLLRRGITDEDGKKDIDDALAELVQKSDESFNLADDAREKEIITEGIIAYIDSASMVPFGNEIKAAAETFKTDIDENVAEATQDVEAAKVLLQTRLAELSAAAAAKDRSELFLDSLEETGDYIDDVSPPEEDIQEILAQVEQTFESEEEEEEES